MSQEHNIQHVVRCCIISCRAAQTQDMIYAIDVNSDFKLICFLVLSFNCLTCGITALYKFLYFVLLLI